MVGEGCKSLDIYIIVADLMYVDFWDQSDLESTKAQQSKQEL